MIKSIDEANLWDKMTETPTISGDYIEGDLPELKKLNLNKVGKSNESDEDLLDRIENYLAFTEHYKKLQEDKKPEYFINSLGNIIELIYEAVERDKQDTSDANTSLISHFNKLRNLMGKESDL